jgi:hypothetical protein
MKYLFQDEKWRLSGMFDVTELQIPSNAYVFQIL